MIKIVWSERKNRSNIVKHRIDFNNAKTVLTILCKSQLMIRIILLMNEDLLQSEKRSKIIW